MHCQHNQRCQCRRHSHQRLTISVHAHAGNAERQLLEANCVDAVSGVPRVEVPQTSKGHGRLEQPLQPVSWLAVVFRNAASGQDAMDALMAGARPRGPTCSRCQCRCLLTRIGRPSPPVPMVVTRSRPHTADARPPQAAGNAVARRSDAAASGRRTAGKPRLCDARMRAGSNFAHQHATRMSLRTMLSAMAWK